MRPAINTQNPGPYKPTRASHQPKLLTREEIEAVKAAKEAKKAKKAAKKLECILREKNEAALKEISEINATLEQLQRDVGTIRQLPENYASIKAQSWCFFKDPAREVGANFIASIATSLKNDLSNINPEEIAAKDVKQLAINTKQIIDGAYLHVLQSIKISYEHAWFSKDPNNSALYRLLNPRVVTQTTDEQKLSLEALKVFLETNAHNHIVFGQKDKEQTQIAIQSQIDLLYATPKLHS